jgi:hypothetical protein
MTIQSDVGYVMGEYEGIRRSIMVPIVASVLLLAAVFVTGMWLQTRRQIHRKIETQVAAVQDLLCSETEEDATMLHGLTDLLQRDERAQQAWLARDRDALLARTLPVFEQLREKYRVTHFYFHDLDRKCFLRVHQPDRWGDLITRFTLSEAVQRGEPTEGVELGPLGTLTLRVVHPWKIGGQHVGYVELGCEIDQILRRMKNAAGGELIVFAEKEYLDRQQWEAGMKMVGREPDWDEFADHVVLDATMPGTLQALAGRFTEAHATGSAHSFSLSFEGRSYQCAPMPLADAAGKRIGHILVMADVTREHAGLGTLAGAIAGVGLPLAAVWCCCFYFYIRRLERRLVATHKSRLLELERLYEAEEHVHELERATT